MNYEEACEATVTRKQAKAFIALHDCEGWAVFLEDCGDRPEYTVAEVHAWLGY